MTLGAEKGTATADNDAFNGDVADGAGLPHSLVDLKKILMGTFGAVGKDVLVVGSGGTLVEDSLGNNADNSLMKCFDLRRLKLVGFGGRMNAGQKKGIVGIDIANTGKTVLIKKDEFDGAGGVELGGKVVNRKGWIENVAAKM